MENFWQACSTQLELELTPQQYTAWIKPLVALDYEDGKLRIAAPNRFKLDWVKSQFANRITALASDFWERPVDVLFVLDPRNLPKKPDAVTNRQPTSSTAEMASGAIGINAAADNTAPAMPVITPDNVIANNPRREQSRVNPELTFDNFVTGKANQLARAAAIQVAEQPGRLVQPAVLLRRRRPRQDPPDPRDRQPVAGGQAGRAHPLHPRRAVCVATW